MNGMRLWRIALALVVLVALLAVAACQTAATEKTEKDSPKQVEIEKVKIEKITDNLFRIIGLENKEVFYDTYGYGDIFADALRKLGKDYKILSVTPINYMFGRGSLTREILVLVEPKL